MTNPTGLFPRLRRALFGEKPARLAEKLQSTHWLSYLLVMVQSTAVVLVLGSSQLPLLANGDLFTRLIVGLAFFVLVATVWASDMALLATLKRIPALSRNRATAALYEHVLYVVFVLLIEACTYGIVVAAIDKNPQALLGNTPLIPSDGPLFIAQVVLRAALLGWTTIQLFIVSGELPPQLSTLLSTGKSIVGAHVEKQLTQLDLSGASLAASFRVYAAMSKPPRRIRTLLNGRLVKRDAHREAEEERQSLLVIQALTAFEQARVSEINTASGQAISGTKPLSVNAPTAGQMERKTGTSNRPIQAKKPSKQEPQIRLVDPNPKPKKRAKLTAEEKVRKVIERYGDVGTDQLAKLAKVSKNTARKYRDMVLSEQQTMEATQ